MAYDAVGMDLFGLGQLGQASDYFSTAFRLREHASEGEKLRITANYYRIASGELDKAAQTYQEWVGSYPRESEAYVALGIVYNSEGQYEKAVEITRQAVRVAGDEASYENIALALYLVALQRLDEARQINHLLQSRNVDDIGFHTVPYALAFLGADSAAMAREQQWFASKHEFENFGLALASDTEAYGGHVVKARELTQRAVDSAVRAGNEESGAIWQAIAAQQAAAYGNAREGRQSAAKALKLAPTSQGVKSETALAFAIAGDTIRAESLAQDLGKRFPLDTQMQSLWLPTIEAQLALNRKNPASALNALQSALPIELGNIPFGNNTSCLEYAKLQ